MRSPHVIVYGNGLAACCAAFLLERAGIGVTVGGGGGRARIPAIMIGAATQALIADVFGRSDIFAGAHPISRRVVAWGAGAAPKTLPHAAVVLSEEELNRRLWPTLIPQHATVASWTIHAAGPLPVPAIERAFGSRMAQAAAVELSPRADSACCWIETLDDGWLFLIPNSARAGWLLAVGGGAEALLSASRVIAPQLAAVSAAAGSFAAYPRIADPLCGSGRIGDRLCGSGWLACGGAAMAFDPICGDGTGNAIREAILAAAVTRRAFRQDLLDHYRSRLMLGFARHLEHCRQFYASGHATPWWREELRQVLAGIEWCRAVLPAGPASRYLLRGFELERIGGGD